MLLQQQASDAQLISPLLNASDDISSTSENHGFDGETEVEVEVGMETDVTLNISLPAGSYATAFVRELMKNNDFI